MADCYLFNSQDFSHLLMIYLFFFTTFMCDWEVLLYSVFTHITSIYANLLEQKKRIYLPLDWFETQTWP